MAGQNAATTRIRELASRYRIELAMLGALMLLCTALTILQPRFLSPLNLQNVLSQVMVLGIIAIGQTMVILTGGIDLSVGGIAAIARGNPGRNKS